MQSTSRVCGELDSKSFCTKSLMNEFRLAFEVSDVPLAKFRDVSSINSACTANGQPPLPEKTRSITAGEVEACDPRRSARSCEVSVLEKARARLVSSVIGTRIWALMERSRDGARSEEHPSELQSRGQIVCRLL